MFKHIQCVLIELFLFAIAVYSLVNYISIKQKYDKVVSGKTDELVFSPPETIFVTKDKIIEKVKREFVIKVDTLYKYDTLYVIDNAIWRAGIKREFLDIFELVDTLKFSFLDNNTGLFGIEGLIYQTRPLPVLMDIRLKDDGIWYSWGTLKSWNGRIEITARYYDERNQFRFYTGGGVLVGNGLFGGLGVLYREKYLTNLFLTTQGDIGIGLQIKIK